MKRAGKYSDRCLWKQRTTTRSELKQEVESWVDNGYLWCEFEVEAGRKDVNYGAKQTGQDATIRIRNYPEFKALDRLYRPEWDQTWIIDDLYIGDNELVCSAHTFETLNV